MMNEQQAYQALETLINSSEYQSLSKELQQQRLFDLSKEVNADIAGSRTVLYSGEINNTKNK